MFCQNCGEKIVDIDGVKFCQKCGAQINSATVQTTPTPQAVPVQQSNIGTPTQQPNTGSVTGNTGKLIRTAAIVAVGIWVVFYAAVFYNNFIRPVDYSRYMPDGLSIEQREQWEQFQAEQNTFSYRIKAPHAYEATVMPLIFLAALAIPIALSFLGWKKNNRIMVLIAGIIYIYPIVIGIPSGIMCIIAFRKMKKPA